jgi:ActR/RegA family two-component response regulator
MTLTASIVIFVTESSSAVPLQFLIIDDNSDSRFLLARTLLRKFPTAALMECCDDGIAATIAAAEKVDAIVIHRTGESTGLEMLPILRRVNANVPIVMVSGINRSAAAMKAGASYFLIYDEWLRIGTVVAGLLTFKNGASLQPFAQGDEQPRFATG